jgi:hypothetical protein
MIDPSLMKVMHHALVVFYLTKYLIPLILGFCGITGFQLSARFQQSLRPPKLGVFLTSSVSYIVLFYGWMNIGRSPATVFMYAAGAGIAFTVMSQVYAISLPEYSLVLFNIRWPKVLWKGDLKGVREFQQRVGEAMRSQKAA